MKANETMPDEMQDKISETQIENGNESKKLTKQICLKLKSVLSDKELTQNKLGDLTGISTATISKWFTGDSAISLVNLYKVSDALGLSLDWLCGKSDEQFTKTIESDKEACLAFANIYAYISAHYGDDAFIMLDSGSDKGFFYFDTPIFGVFLEGFNQIKGVANVVDRDNYMKIMGSYIDSCIKKAQEYYKKE